GEAVVIPTPPEEIPPTSVTGEAASFEPAAETAGEEPNDPPTSSPQTGEDTPIKAVTRTNLNLRAGPGTNYAVVGGIPTDTEVTVVGKNQNGSWLRVQTGSGEVWISGDPDLVSVDRSLLTGLPVVAAPPAPAAPAFDFDTSNEMVNRVLTQIPLVVHHDDGHHTCASHAGLNNLLPVFNGARLGPHSGDFVAGADNVLFEYANGTFKLMRESPNATFANNEKYISFEEAIRMLANGEITWTGSFGDWPARGVPGCDPEADPNKN
ncbi:MAG: SH3 domain-containing protein, partial [Anaerolineae bacterium]|nr:SH3 domain-containing protein [Anaerolineae bacterium]